MKSISVSDVFELINKPLFEVLKKLGNPTNKIKSGAGFVFKYMGKDESITFDVIAGKIKKIVIDYSFYNKANLGVKKFRIRQELLNAGYEFENSPYEIQGSKGKLKVSTLTSSTNAKNYNLQLISIIEK